MSDWTYNQPDVMREIARLEAENAKLNVVVEAVQGVLASECPSQVAGNVEVEYYWMRKLESALAALEKK